MMSLSIVVGVVLLIRANDAFVVGPGGVLTTTPTRVAFTRCFMGYLDDLGRDEDSVLRPLNFEEFTELVNEDLRIAEQQSREAEQNANNIESQLRVKEVEHARRVEELIQKIEPEDQGLVDAQEQFRQASTNVNKLEMEIRVKEKQQQSASDLDKDEVGDREKDLQDEIEGLKFQLLRERANKAMSTAAVMDLKDKMKKQEQELMERVGEIGTDATRQKLQAHQEKMALMEEHRQREESLQAEMNILNEKLESERNNANMANELSNRINSTRLELETELGDLKRMYEQEQKDHQRDVQQAKQQMEQQNAKSQQNVADLEEKLRTLQESFSSEMAKLKGSTVDENEFFCAQQAAREAREQAEKLEEELQRKEEAQRETVASLEEELKKQSAEIEALSTRMSDDTEISKEEAEREKASLVRKYENVQKRLECEVRLLKNRLTGERARSIKSTTKARDIQLEMKKKEEELDLKEKELETEAAMLKEAAEQEKAELMEQSRKREEELLQLVEEKSCLMEDSQQREQELMDLVQDLSAKLEAETVNKSFVKTKLNEVKKTYEAEQETQREALAKAKIAVEEAAKENQALLGAMTDLKDIKKDVSKLQAERSDVGALAQRTFSVMLQNLGNNLGIELEDDEDKKRK